MPSTVLDTHLGRGAYYKFPEVPSQYVCTFLPQIFNEHPLNARPFCETLWVQ